MLTRRLAERARDQGRETIIDNFMQRADEAEHNAHMIRAIILNGHSIDVVNTTEDQVDTG